MRGDSVRDFYAKTLALMGLGVLAGTGALVDYWPAGIRLPVSSSGWRESVATVSAPVPPPPPVRALETSLLTGELRITTRLRTPPEVTPAPRLATSAVWPPDLVRVTLERPSAAPEQIVTMASLVLTETAPFAETASALPAILAAPAGTDAPGGALMGAFRRTGATIKKSGLKTGSSIVGAFRAVGDAVRKALPLGS